MNFLKAISEGKLAKVKEVIQAGVSPDGENPEAWTPLMVAVENEQLEIIDFLLGAGANINKPDQFGQTPLHIAVDLSIDTVIQTNGNQGEENTEIISYLIEKGANLNAKENRGKTPLDIAKSYQSQKVIRLLEGFEPSGGLP